MGLPRSVQVPAWVRSRLSSEGTASAIGELGAPIPDLLPFWSKRLDFFTKASQPLTLAKTKQVKHGVCQARHQYTIIDSKTQRQ